MKFRLLLNSKIQKSLTLLSALFFLGAISNLEAVTATNAVSNIPVATTSAPAAPPISTKDIDGKWQRLPPVDHVTVIMYTNPDLEQASRDMSAAFDTLRGLKKFAFMQVIDLRGDVPAIARGLVGKEVRKHEDREAVRVQPFYIKNGNKSNPRPDMIAITDFSGNILNYLGWHNRYNNIHLIVYDKAGQELKRFDQVDDPAAVNLYVKGLVKPSSNSSNKVRSAPNTR